MPSLKSLSVFSSVLLMGAQAGHATFVAPPNTNAGIVERQIQDEYTEKEVKPVREVPLLEIDIPEERLQMGDGESVFIKTIDLEGNEVLSKKKIRKVIRPYEERDLSMGEIKELCKQLQDLYIENGYFLARVYPPPQEVKEGHLTLEVIEGKLGEVTVQGNKHYKESFIKSYFTKFEGKAINYDELLRALFLLNENTDLNAGAVFKKGSAVGTADLIIRVNDKWPFHLYVDENNYGAKQTTIWRTGAQLTYGNLFTSGDTLAITEVVGNPVSVINFTNASYTVPLNRIGTAMKLNYLYSNFDIEQFTSLHLRGLTQVGTLEFTQALSRTRKISTDLYLSFDFKQLHNYQQNKTSSYDKLRVFNLGYMVDYMDSLKGRNVGDVSISYGVPHFLGGLHTVDPLCSRDGAGGLFAILNVDYTRVQSLPKDCFLTLRVAGQATPYKLPTSMQLYIGGVDTVRGYPMAAALGDDGYYANLEFRAPLPYIRDDYIPFSKSKRWKDFFQLVAFVDNGAVALNGGGENQSHHIMMTGAGAGVRIYAPYRINVAFDVGFPLTDKMETHSPIFYFKVGVQPF